MAGQKGRSGRKKLIDEEKAQRLCITAIEKKYGSLEKGVESILNGVDESLKKFIWQHAIGAVPVASKVQVSNPDGSNLIPQKYVLEVVRTEHNKNVDATESTNLNSI